MDVNNFSKIKYKLIVYKYKLSDRLMKFFDTIPETIIKHKDVFLEEDSCKAKKSYYSTQPGLCNDSEIKAFRKAYNDMRPDLKDSLEKFMKSIYIEDFYIYIIHSSNKEIYQQHWVYLRND